MATTAGIREVREHARAAAESVLARWLPEGKRQGREYVALNPTRSDERPGSFSVNLDTGIWSDFATNDKGGDLVSLVAYLDGTKQGEAAETLARFLGLKVNGTPRHNGHERPQAAPGPEVNATLSPIPPEALTSRPQAHPRHGRPSGTWEYRDPAGRPLAYVLRFDPPEGRKQFAPLTWDGARWQWRAPPAPRPLYGLDRLAARPDAPALVAEGEKAAGAARELLPDVVALTTWGGAQAPAKSDFGPLKGRRVLVWPDNDGPGAGYAVKVAELARAAGALSVEVLDLASLARDPATGAARDLPPGWDAADALADGWTPEALAAAVHWRTDQPETDPGGPPRPEALEITPEELAMAELTPRCIVDSYLYADVAQLVAPGGTGKTTIVLREAVCIALGRPLYGLRVFNPGWTLIVTAEDARARLVARLREIMAALDLTPEERATVMRSVRIWDVTGMGLRLITLSDGTVALTTLADQIIEAYRADPPALIVFDPTVSFGASESLVNDNEQGLITAARRLVRDLDCCVRFVHHTGKANAREGTLDQYSGRGGSALPDGSRMTAVLQTWSPNETTRTPPPGLVADHRSSVTILARAKLTYARPNLPLIWIQRTGWAFDHFVDLPQTPEARRAESEAQLLRYLGAELARGRYHTARTLDDLAGDIGMTRTQLRSALAALRAAGAVADVELPEGQRHGRRQSYLRPAQCADHTEPSGAIDPEEAAQCADEGGPVSNAPPYRDWRNGAIDRHAPSPVPTQCAETDGAMAAQWRNGDGEDIV